MGRNVAVNGLISSHQRHFHRFLHSMCRRVVEACPAGQEQPGGVGSGQHSGSYQPLDGTIIGPRRPRSLDPGDQIPRRPCNIEPNPRENSIQVSLNAGTLSRNRSSLNTSNKGT